MVLVLGVSAACVQPASAAWAPAAGPLLTRWAKDVSPDKVHPEYPRPQMVRPRWLNLNGLWDYAVLPVDAPQPEKFDGQILVPFPIEAALSGVMRQVSEKERLWYRRTFIVPPDFAGGRLLLHFGAVDWEAAVFVNGRKAGEHRGGYDSFTCDITDALRPGGRQELVVAVWDPSDSGPQPRGKQVHKPGGIWYTPTTGIWQTVWLEPVPEQWIGGIRIVPDVDNSAVRITVDVQPQAQGKSAAVKAVVKDGGRPVAEATGPADAPLEVRIPQPKLWSPDSPFLYDLEVRLGQTDAVQSYFGMRKVEIGKDPQGVTRILLNGKFVMQAGFLDQGFWPDGLYTAPTDQALRYDIEMTLKFGMNMARKHVKIEPERWYYWADRLGLLVWQDMPSGSNGMERRRGPDGKPLPPTPKDDAAAVEARRQFEKELVRMVEGLRNHPSIIMWVVFNEGWGQFDTERLTALVKNMDPSRLVNNASGWTDTSVGDVHDIHSYPNPKCPPTEEKRAAVLGEFGGLGLAVQGHLWKKESWGYKGMADAEHLTRTYEKLLRTVYDLKDSAGLCAAVYTQTTDVEVECNGLMTYDRVVKGDVERLAAVNRGDFSKVPPAPVVRSVVPTAEESPQEWRYVTEKPAGDWTKPAFDDSAWKKGRSGFGTKGTPGAVVRTEWRTTDIWLRREFQVPAGDFSALQLRVHHDEDTEVYINGVLACQLKGFATDYDEQPLAPEARAAFRPGKNVLAVHCRQTGGGQYIDVGIVEVVPAKAK
ncbi:MAG: glycoside hydrolase family 2 [Planctomycetes bacterium]|nr:glycoside hydrolase family 2 [Planctomycetota bacterium]